MKAHSSLSQLRTLALTTGCPKSRLLYVFQAPSVFTDGGNQDIGNPNRDLLFGSGRQTSTMTGDIRTLSEMLCTSRTSNGAAWRTWRTGRSYRPRTSDVEPLVVRSPYVASKVMLIFQCLLFCDMYMLFP